MIVTRGHTQCVQTKRERIWCVRCYVGYLIRLTWNTTEQEIYIKLSPVAELEMLGVDISLWLFLEKGEKMKTF